jgi:hypothetical protein
MLAEFYADFGHICYEPPKSGKCCEIAETFWNSLESYYNQK